MRFSFSLAAFSTRFSHLTFNILQDDFPFAQLSSFYSEVKTRRRRRRKKPFSLHFHWERSFVSDYLLVSISHRLAGHEPKARRKKMGKIRLINEFNYDAFFMFCSEGLRKVGKHFLPSASHSSSPQSTWSSLMDYYFLCCEARGE